MNNISSSQEEVAVAVNAKHNTSKAWVTTLAAACTATVLTFAIALQPGTTAGLNSEVKVDELLYIIHGAGSQRAVGHPPTQTSAPSNATFVVVDCSVRNSGRTTSTDVGRGFYLSDSKGRKYTRSALAEGAYVQLGHKYGMKFIVSQLQPGEAKRAKTVFQVPDRAWADGVSLVIPTDGFIRIKPVSVRLN